MVMSKSEAGKLGAQAFKIIANKEKEKRVEQYDINPAICHYCKNSLPYEKRNYKYCSRSCSVSTANLTSAKRKRKNPKNTHCLQCENSLTESLKHCQYDRKFCSRQCFIDYRFETKTKPSVERGKIDNRMTLKRYLIKERGACCEKCKGTEWLDSLIPLELNHIDGNASNNFPINLQLLCPNCHALEPTSKGKNRGNGRKSRGLRL